jgi:acyl-CoA thioester hydrolase
MNTTKYKHNISEKVKFHEVDMLGVCNNAVYFNYFEDARIDYLQTLARKYSFEKFLQNESFVIMAHNEIDYINSAYLNDELTVYSRIVKVSKSSFSFDHYILRDSDKKDIAKGRGVIVHINKNSKKSMPLPEEFHRAILDFEGV